jgi:hypothetical protein
MKIGSLFSEKIEEFTLKQAFEFFIFDDTSFI